LLTGRETIFTLSDGKIYTFLIATMCVALCILIVCQCTALRIKSVMRHRGKM